MPQIKQKAVLQVIFLPEYLRISSVWSHHTHTIHTSLSYVSGDSVIAHPGNAEATSLSLPLSPKHRSQDMYADGPMYLET